MTGLSENLMKLNISKTKELVIKGRNLSVPLSQLLPWNVCYIWSFMEWHFRIVLPTGISIDDLMERALKRMHILDCVKVMVIVYLTLLPRFAAQGSLLPLIALFRAIIHQFSSKIFLIFLILVSCKNKAMSAYSPWKKVHSFSLLFLSSLESFSVLVFRAKLGECVALWFVFTSPPLKWLTEQKNPFEVC